MTLNAKIGFMDFLAISGCNTSLCHFRRWRHGTIVMRSR